MRKMQKILKKNIVEVDFTKLHIGSEVLLVTGKSSYDSCGASAILNEKLQNHNVMHFTGFETNPRIEDVRKGLNLLNDTKTIIAVGGGSVLDMAKLLKGLSDQEFEIEEYIQGRRKLRESRNINLIAIPTTSGSGSESTHFAVVYIDKVKYSLAHRSLLPETVILDYKLTLSMSPYLTACSGLDALSQGIESFWSVNADVESSAYSRESLYLSIENLVNAVKNPDDYNKAAMQLASNLAGKAINITKTTAPHAFSYYLTSHFHIPHGYAAALMLGKFIVFNSRVTEKDISDRDMSLKSVKTKISELCQILGAENPEQANQIIDGMIRDCGLKYNLPEIVDLDRYFEDIFNSVNLERLKNNPRLILEKQELLELLKRNQ